MEALLVPSIVLALLVLTYGLVEVIPRIPAISYSLARDCFSTAFDTAYYITTLIFTAIGFFAIIGLIASLAFWIGYHLLKIIAPFVVKLWDWLASYIDHLRTTQLEPPELFDNFADELLHQAYHVSPPRSPLRSPEKPLHQGKTPQHTARRHYTLQNDSMTCDGPVTPVTADRRTTSHSQSPETSVTEVQRPLGARNTRVRGPGMYAVPDEPGFDVGAEYWYLNERDEPILDKDFVYVAPLPLDL